MKTTSKLFLSLSAVLCVLSSLDATLSCGDQDDRKSHLVTKQTTHLSQIVPFDGSVVMAPSHISPSLARVVEKPTPPIMSRDLAPNTKVAVPPSLQSSEAAREPDPSLPTGILIVSESLMKNEVDFFEELRRRNAAFLSSGSKPFSSQPESKKNK